MDFEFLLLATLPVLFLIFGAAQVWRDSRIKTLFTANGKLIADKSKLTAELDKMRSGYRSSSARHDRELAALKQKSDDTLRIACGAADEQLAETKIKHENELRECKSECNLALDERDKAEMRMRAEHDSAQAKLKAECKKTVQVVEETSRQKLHLLETTAVRDIGEALSRLDACEKEVQLWARKCSEADQQTAAIQVRLDQAMQTIEQLHQVEDQIRQQVTNQNEAMVFAETERLSAISYLKDQLEAHRNEADEANKDLMALCVRYQEMSETALAANVQLFNAQAEVVKLRSQLAQDRVAVTTVWNAFTEFYTKYTEPIQDEDHYDMSE